MHRYISRIIKIVVFIFLVVITDQVVGFILRKLYFNQKAGKNHALTYAFRDCKADILIFGASQAQHNYDSRIISDSLKMSCYNAGQDGGHSIIMQYAQIKVITERYSPKIIILEFHPNSIVHYAGDYDRLSILLPYIKEYPELRTIILLRSPYEKIKLLSAIYPFNSNIINILRFNTNTHAAHRKDYEGYVPIKDKVMNQDMLKEVNRVTQQTAIDTNKLLALKNIIWLCKRKNVKLFIIKSPIFHEHEERKYTLSLGAKQVMEIIHREKITYLDFSNDPYFAGHMEWFADNVHLNEKGAQRFSCELVRSLKSKEK